MNLSPLSRALLRAGTCAISLAAAMPLLASVTEATQPQPVAVPQQSEDEEPDSASGTAVSGDQIIVSGKRIRGQWKLVEMEEKRPGQWQQTVEITIEIEGEDKPALICEWMTLFFC